MQYKKASEEHTDIIFNIVQNTVTTIYPKYYPKEVVDFFCQLHSRENITRDIENGNVGILVVDNQIVGTGSHEDNHITRVYVLPKYQKRGCGTYIIKSIETEIADKYDKAWLEASLPAALLYEKLGFVTIKHEQYCMKNGAVLVYEIMEKEFN